MGGRRNALLKTLVLVAVCLPASLASAASRGPRAIISLSPSVTEILYGLGAFERVIAVSDYCDYPPAVKSLPRVGGWMSTNFEQVASLGPDLVILTEAQAAFARDLLAALGVPTLVVASQSLSDIFGAIRDIGRAVGNEREAQALASTVRSELEGMRARTATGRRPRVLCVVDRLPGTVRDLYVATRGSYLSELIEIAGGEPLTPPSKTSYAKINIEAVVALDPEVILDMVQGARGSLGEQTLAVWKELPDLRAVRDQRVYSLRETSLIHPSHRVGEAARRIAEILHPEAWVR
jgi:iron complex transport system substrate-binding protein